ncbi:MAG: HlyD family efflux transporter periplasmic adaptor subunit, partial [Cyanobacteriota bacterium]|nr:HlyD family efflux transporter periplasmic adaptor subunit [Cyanobacteriota bacterium]
QIEQQRSLGAAKGAQMEEVRGQLGEVTDTDADELGRVAAATATARVEVEAAVAQISSQRQLASKWEDDVEQLLVQREKLKLVARTAGTAVTPDLDLLDGTRLEAGVEVLSVVDLGQLTARARIRQEDRDLVESAAKVRFYRQGDGQPYWAAVSDSSVVPVVQVSERQQKPMVEVRMEIDNRQRLLLPGMEGYAHIQTRKLRVYQKVGREFNKLLNWGKYVPWLEGDSRG